MQNYGIDRISLGGTVNDLESESKLLLVQRREGHMGIYIYRNNSIKRDCNVLSIFNPTKHAKYKIRHYSPILQGCMNTHSGRG